MQISIPENIISVMTLLEESGFEAYAVGGCVRDSLLDRKPYDWDVCTSATPEEILEVFKEFRTIPTGIKHGTVTVIADSPIEITTFRKEDKYLNYRVPSKVTYINSLEEEAFNLSKEKVTLKEHFDTKNNELKDLNIRLENITKEWEQLDLMSNNTLSDKEQELIKLHAEKQAEKEKIQIRINSISKDIDLLKTKIEEQQAQDKLKNSSLRNLERESRDLEISINRIDVKLDNMLTTLSEEYEMTFERAKKEYVLGS